MKFYWSLHSIPEIAELPRSQRVRALSVCRAEISRVSSGLILALVILVLMSLGYALGMQAIWWLPYVVAGTSGGVGVPDSGANCSALRFMDSKLAASVISFSSVSATSTSNALAIATIAPFKSRFMSE